MCQVFCLEHKEKQLYTSIKYKTFIECDEVTDRSSKKVIEGTIEGKLMRVGQQRSFYSSFLGENEFYDNDLILFIDHFYPFGRIPDKDCLGKNFGITCLNLVQREILNFKAIIITSVGTNNQHMHKFLEANSFCMIKKMDP